MPLFPLRAASSLRVIVTSAAVITGVAAGSAHAQDPAPATQPAAPAPTGKAIKQGVTVNGVDLSGQTREQAIATLTPALTGAPSTKDVVVRVGGRSHRLKMASIRYGYDVEKTASRARNATAGSPVVPVYAWDAAKLRSFSTKVSKTGRAARNATVRIGISKQKIRGSKTGWRVTIGAVEQVVTAALNSPASDRSKLLVKVQKTKPAVTINGLRNKYGTLITVDRNTFTLRLFKKLKLSKTYKIAVGQAGHGTPAGMYSITSKQVNPAWYVPNSDWAGSLQGQVIPGGAPNNPLKARWLGLRDGIGIHGTAEAWSIGSRASHGCIRMHPSDVIDLYDRVPMGTTVKIR
jgi:lipoprotein-anchoring transpeptidase ErfK/SrfK